MAQYFYSKQLSFTLRSWVHEVFSRFGTVSPGLGDNYASKWGSGIFPHTKYMSRCVENSQNHTLLLRFSPILGRRIEKQGKLWDKVFLAFQIFFQDWRKTKQQSVVLRIFHTPWHIFCVWKNARTPFWCIVVSQSRGDRSKTWENFMDSGSKSETYAFLNNLGQWQEHCYQVILPQVICQIQTPIIN